MPSLTPVSARGLAAVVAVVASMLFAADPARAEGPGPRKAKAKVAFVDVERCVGETEDGLRAKASLKKFSERRQTAIAQMEEKLQQQQTQLNQQAQASGGGGASAIAGAVLAYQRELQRYNEAIKRSNAEIAAREEELFAPLERKVKEVFGRIAEGEGYDMVLDKKALPTIIRPELDLTERVIRELNWGVSPAGKTGAVTTAPKG